MIKDSRIDGGNEFDWGRASSHYSKYRDIYPQEFYDNIVKEGICIKGQDVLDLGTGTGVLPRNMHKYGANFVGTDIAENQIAEAIKLSQEAGMDIVYKCCSAENTDYEKHSFDVITACQCFFYFNHDIVAEKLYSLLRPGGKLVILYMAWLPLEDKIARLSEDLVLKYNPSWSGGRETRHHNVIPDSYSPFFDIEKEDVYDLYVPFTRETWNGRMIACRGTGASLSKQKLQEFEREHLELLSNSAPREFEVLHYVAMTILKAKSNS